MLVTLVEHPDGHGLTAAKFLTAADLDPATVRRAQRTADDARVDAAFRTVLWDTATSAPAIPNGTMGDRYNDAGKGRWNLDLGDLSPALSLADVAGACLLYTSRCV